MSVLHLMYAKRKTVKRYYRVTSSLRRVINISKSYETALDTDAGLRDAFGHAKKLGVEILYIIQDAPTTNIARQACD